jgi:isoprenylcysteine carboxyl methyltransferase (ICMT) family protein YpbQ
MLGLINLLFILRLLMIISDSLAIVVVKKLQRINNKSIIVIRNSKLSTKGVSSLSQNPYYELSMFKIISLKFVVHIIKSLQLLPN